MKIKMLKIKEKIKKWLNEDQIEKLKITLGWLYRLIIIPIYMYARFIKTPYNLTRNKNKRIRYLEIGPAAKRLEGFETVNVVFGSSVDYIVDASKKLPFDDNTFDIIHASHILEHTPWFKLSQTIKEWSRILKPEGILEIWVPDGYKLSKFIVDIENGIQREEWLDDWRPLNKENNPYKWANGRILYGAVTSYPSWHTSIITPKFLESIMKENGLVKVEKMEEDEARSARHGWINLGIRGIKK
jgi:SAM-dependent methyltransferase